MGSTGASSPSSEPLAIIGLSCKFAGDASNQTKFWQMLEEGRSAWSEIPSSRFVAKGNYHPDHERLSTSHVRGAHFFHDDLANFDAAFFNYSAETASTLDPQFRLQLESVYEALENAGLPLPQIAGSNTSVFAGTFVHDYRESLVRDEDNIPKFFFTGTGSAMASNRISHFFDFRGASMTLDTGCSSSMVALHQAVQSLRSGESDMSVVGGSNVILNPDTFKAMGSLGFLSPDGKCFAFDSRANGYGRGEGVATVVIKRLSDAIASGDAVRAVIREILSNQDGKTETITTPSMEAQQALIRACYVRAGLDPRGTQYFEAHGTGTAKGDPIEASAVASVFRDTTKAPMHIGSVKTNIGHTEATSGLAGMIKVVLAMERGKIPPSINFEKPNPKLSLEEWNLKVVTQLEDWPDSPQNPRRASVNSFGYGGSNAHAILEHGQSWCDRYPKLKEGLRSKDEPDCRTKLLILSAKDEEACQNMASNLKTFLVERKRQRSDDMEIFLESLVYTLGERRTMFQWLSAYPIPITRNIDSIVSALDSPKFRPSRVSSSKSPRIGFVFTGQGAQWYAMGRELVSYPIFKESILEGDAYLRQYGSAWSLMEELHRDAETTNVNKVGHSIPICSAIQISLVRLLASWNITPSAMVSHSSGEIAAAYTVGAISYRYAMGIAYHRSALAAESVVDGTIKGGMIAVGLGCDESEDYLSRLKSNSKAVVACVNSPSSTTIAGDIEAVEELEQVLKAAGIFARRLRVDVAYHSHHMKGIANEYRDKLNAIADNEKKIQDGLHSVAFASPTTGYRVTSARQLANPNHWVASLLQPVQFIDAMTEMTLSDGLDSSSASVDILVEVGPHTALGGPIQQILELPEFDGLRLPYYGCLVRNTDALETTQALAAALLCKGYPVKVRTVNFPQGKGPQVKVLTDLPPYPWNHQTRHWIEPRTNKGLRQREEPPNELLGSLVPGANFEIPTWRHFLRPTEAPWLRDHVIQSNMLYPGCGFIALAIEAVRQQNGWRGHQSDDLDSLNYHVRDFNVVRALLVPDSASGLEIQTTIRPASDKAIGLRGWKQFDIFSVTFDNQWSLHATGMITVRQNLPYHSGNIGLSQKLKPGKHLDLDAVYSRRIDPTGMWDVLEELGIQYGPKFRNITSIVQSRRDMLSRSTISMNEDPDVSDLARDCVMHPAMLDAIAQTTYTALPGVDCQQDSPRVLQSIKQMWISHKFKQSASSKFDCYTLLHRADEQGIEADIRMGQNTWDGDEPMLEIKGLEFSSLGQTINGTETKSWERSLCSRVEWSCFQDPIPVPDDFRRQLKKDAVEYTGDILRRLVHENPRARILEFGTGAVTQSMLASICSAQTGGPHASSYHLTSTSGAALETIRNNLSQWSDVLSIQELDIHQQPFCPNLELASYDIVLASQVLGDTTSVSSSLQNLRSLIRPGGRFLFSIETSGAVGDQVSNGNENQHLSTSLAFWSTAIKDAGFSHVNTIHPAKSGESILSTVLPNEVSELPPPDKIVLVVNGGNATEVPQRWLDSLQQSIRASGSHPGKSPTICTLTSEQSSYVGKTCIFLGELSEPILRGMDTTTFEAVKIMATSCDALLWVTRGGSVESQNPDMALAHGFIRSLRHEYLSRSYLTLDLDPNGQLWSDHDISAIIQVLKRTFASRESADRPTARDFEYAERNGSVMIPRLFRDIIRDEVVSQPEKQETTSLEPLRQSGRPLFMDFGKLGLLDSLVFVEDDAARLALDGPISPELIEIEPRAYGVNFRDVMVAMGQLDEHVFGLECAGVITRVGSDAAANGYAAGDAVCCLLRSSFSSQAYTPWTNVMHIPSGISFEEAASLPIVYFTAYTCLVELAHLKSGQTILIHAAAGGVGQAAIMIARHLGAEIFATVHSREKRALLTGRYGIPEDHIFSSREISFAGGVRARTNGRGVDVVLNSLAGPLLQESFNLLAPYGHFLEIGKRDLESNNLLEMSPFCLQASFTAFYAISYMLYKPLDTHHALSEIARLIEAKAISPVHPIKSYPVAEAVSAFRLLQTGSHMGKVVLSTGPQERVPVKRRRDIHVRLSGDASYLLVGGLGGLGYSIAHWMIKNGAKNLILLSRNAGNEKSTAQIDALRDSGCRVVPVSCNVANESDLTRALERLRTDEIPPIRGIIQSAMVLQDAVLEKMSREQFETAILPKVNGTWNLHNSFSTAASLDFFVILSSVVGVVGNTSQVNYGAAGSFQDALARYRCSQGLPAVSIDLGGVKGIGVAAETAGVLSRLRRAGHTPLSEDQVLAVLSSAISAPFEPQVVVGLNSHSGRHWDADGESQLGRDQRFAGLRPLEREGCSAATGNSPDSLASKLNAANSVDEATSCVGTALAEKISETFMIPAGEIDLMKPPTEYGIDSLVAVELRNMLVYQARSEVSIFTIMQSSSLHELSAEVATKSSFVKAA